MKQVAQLAITGDDLIMIIDCVSTIGANMNGAGEDIPTKQKERMLGHKKDYLDLMEKLLGLLEKGAKNEPN